MGNQSSDNIWRKTNLQAKEVEWLYVFGRVVQREREREGKEARQIHFNLHLNYSKLNPMIFIT